MELENTINDYDYKIIKNYVTDRLNVKPEDLIVAYKYFGLMKDIMTYMGPEISEFFIYKYCNEHGFHENKFVDSQRFPT